MQTLTVGLGERSYPIHIGTSLDYGRLVSAELKKCRQVMVVTNETIAPLYLEKTRKELEAQNLKVSECILKDGEAYKTEESWMAILTALLEEGFARDGALVALGGGVIGDMTGFAAACYERGIAYVQIPTTLLAMVDSSVGGKTAINHPLGKNMIGAFYQPKAVIADISTLRTLPEREIAAGMGEVIKYGIIYDKEFFRYLKENCAKAFAYDDKFFEHVILKSCQIKAEVVAQDEQEHGLRAILNYGHTFGHAIEAFLGFGTWLHGEGVGLGMVIAARLAVKKGLIDKSYADSIEELVERCRLPVKIPEKMQSCDFIKLMHHDKKVRQGTIRYVLPTDFGRCGLFSDIKDNEISDLIEELKH